MPEGREEKGKGISERHACTAAIESGVPASHTLLRMMTEK